MFLFGVIMTEAQEVYRELMLEVLKLRKQLRDLEVQKVLARLANTKEKTTYVRHLEADLGAQLARPLRDNDKVDNLVEILRDLV